MLSKFESAYYLNLSDDEPDDSKTEEDSSESNKYPKIEHDKIDEIDELDKKEEKTIREQEDGEYGRDMSVEKLTERETLLGKRILLKIRSSIVVDISKVGDE